MTKQSTRVTHDADGDNAQKTGAFADRIIGKLCGDGGSLGAFLDVGCGIGSVLRAAKPYATSLAGVDRSEQFLASARAALPDAKFFNTDVADLRSFEDESVDAATFCDVIEHLENPISALREIRRVLRSGGRFLITTPNSDSVFRRLLGRRWFGLSDATHLVFYTPFSLATLLARTGFAVTTSTTLSAAGTGLAGTANAFIERFGQGGTLLIVAQKT